MIFEAADNARVREHNDRMSLAWHIAALPLKKKFPKLAALQVKTGIQKRRQTWQEQMHVMSMWAAVMRKIEASKARIS